MKTDGLGNPLVDDADYYIQDARSFVGNCISWWRANGAGYACDLNDAGVYKGRECGERSTDIPWPVAHVRAHSVTHVRGDQQAFDRRKYVSGVVGDSRIERLQSLAVEACDLHDSMSRLGWNYDSMCRDHGEADDRIVEIRKEVEGITVESGGA